MLNKNAEDTEKIFIMNKINAKISLKFRLNPYCWNREKTQLAIL